MNFLLGNIVWIPAHLPQITGQGHRIHVNTLVILKGFVYGDTNKTITIYITINFGASNNFFLSYSTIVSQY